MSLEDCQPGALTNKPPLPPYLVINGRRYAIPLPFFFLSFFRCITSQFISSCRVMYTGVYTLATQLKKCDQQFALTMAPC